MRDIVDVLIAVLLHVETQPCPVPYTPLSSYTPAPVHSSYQPSAVMGEGGKGTKMKGRGVGV